MLKKLISCLLIFAFLCCLSVQAVAAERVDLSKKGSISVTVKYEGDEASGADLALYQVAALKEGNSGYEYAFVGSFLNCGKSLDKLDQDLAVDLENYAKRNGVQADAVKLFDANDNVSFTGLELGVYLLVQDNAAEGYYGLTSFLVTVPAKNIGGFDYEIEASPKVDAEQIPTESTGETTKDTTEETQDETTEGSEETPESTIPVSYDKLPQTGQLNWPVPVLAFIGLVLFSAGLMLRLKKNKED